MSPQLPLFGRQEFARQERCDNVGRLSALRRIDLGAGAWVDHRAGFIEAHQWLFERLRSDVAWQRHRRMMYERQVDVPRLTGSPTPGTGSTRILVGLGAALSSHYGWDLNQISLAYYRDGRDSVAPHGDKLGELVDNSIVAIVSVGQPRRFIVRSAITERRLSFNLGWGDLLVMGGTCQKTCVHGVPKRVAAGPRISVMFRPEHTAIVEPGFRSAGAQRRVASA